MPFTNLVRKPSDFYFHENGAIRAAMAKQDEYVRYTIRVPAELYDRLKDAAGEKSVNAEIVARLEDSFVRRAAVALSRGDLADLIGTLDRTLWSLGELAKDKSVVGKFNDTKLFSAVYELGSDRRRMLRWKWHMDFEADADLRKRFASAEAYVASQFADLEAGLYQHGMSAGRSGREGE